MKAVEKDTDRRAEVHIYVHGKIEPLQEYGQHIDPRDKAICCYVPVEEGQQPKFGGKFTGTTLNIVHDAVVDGVLRKSSWTVGKSARLQTNKKLDTEKILFKTDDGVIDSEMTVASLSDVTSAQADMQETVGTMELRLYVTRQLTVFHVVDDNKNYDTSSEETTEDGTEKVVHYKQIPPTFKLDIERNSAPISKQVENGYKRKMNAPRPGKEPWAIFRFHYRSKEALDEHKLHSTFDPSSREATGPHVLTLEPVPPLILGTKPHKEDRDTSTRCSSLFSLGTSRAQASKQPSPKLPSPTKQPFEPKASSTATAMASTTEKNAPLFPGKITELNSGSPPSPTPQQGNTEESLQAKTSTKPGDKPSTPQSTTKDVTKGLNAEGFDESCSSTVNGPTIPKLIRHGTNGSAEDEATKVVSIPENKAVPTYDTQNETVSPTNEIVKMPMQPKATPTKKPTSKPSPPPTSTTNPSPNTATLSYATTANKRLCSFKNGKSIEPKRQKVDPTPTLLSTGPSLPPITSRSSTPKTVSIEIQLANQRKKLEEVRKKRQETAKKQAAINVQMAPYKQRMAEELERINKEMMDEESAFTEESEHLHTIVAILEDFKKDEDGN